MQEEIKCQFEELKVDKAIKRQIGASSHDIDREVVKNEERSYKVEIEDEENQVEKEHALDTEAEE